MNNDVPLLDEVMRQGQLISRAVKAKELELVILSKLGARAVGELPSDDRAVDYIIQSPEA